MPDPNRPCLDAVGAWLDVDWSAEQVARYELFADWLSDEGSALGGIGPNEADRIWGRHICDSLTFGRGLTAASSLIDVGTGVGLPGIPLSIGFPHLDVTLVERSGRRTDAMHRVAAMLDLPLRIIQEDVAQYVGTADRIVFRASLNLEEAVDVAPRLLRPAGEAWFGLGRGIDPPALAHWRAVEATMRSDELAIEEVTVPAGILDSPAWLLRMTAK